MSRTTTKIGLSFMALALMVIPALSSAATLYRQLQLGMSGADVTDLQTFLAIDPTIYPQGLVTGYFGSLTKSAVSNFQERNNIDNTFGNGRVGPATMGVINSQMTSGVNTNTNAPVITNTYVSASSNNATVNWSTSENSKGVVYYSTNPLSTYENTNSVTISGANSAMTDSNLHVSQNVTLSNLSTNTLYYYMIYTTDQNGNVTVTWPSTFVTTN